MSSKRYRGVTLNLPMELYEGIERTRAEAYASALGVGENDFQDFMQSVIALGLGDIRKYINDGRLVKIPTLSVS